MKDLTEYDPKCPPTPRIDEPKEELKEMKAHKGICKYCQFEFVKMMRDQRTGKLRPDNCCCIVCGQRYFMKIDDIEAWETGQWMQKFQAI